MTSKSWNLKLVWFVLFTSWALFSTNFASAKIYTINASNFDFSPTKTQVEDGDTVRWILSSGTHSSVSDAFSPKVWSGSITSNPSTTIQVIFTSADGPGPFPYHCGVHPSSMKDTIFWKTLDVEISQVDPLPRNFQLEQNYPNPFNPSTTIRFSLDATSEVQFEVMNVLGQIVEERPLGSLRAGSYEINWDARYQGEQPLPSGIYFYRISTGRESMIRKMILLK